MAFSLRTMIFLSLVLAGTLGANGASAEPLRLITSIKPLALIAQEVAGEDVRVETLLPITASPHDYPLKMSDHRRLHDADLVLWVGPELESFLAKPLANLASGHVLTAYDLPGLSFPAEERGDAEPETEHTGHHHARDPHLWLNPENASVLAFALAKHLAQLAPEKSEIFIQRAQIFAQALKNLDQQLKLELAPIAGRGFAVYHEGYSHFVAHYGLRQLAYITFSPERRPGARHMAELRQQLKTQGGECLFSEPYQQQDSLDALARELQLRQGQLDPIGNASVTSYGQLLANMGQAFSACLNPGD